MSVLIESIGQAIRAFVLTRRYYIANPTEAFGQLSVILVPRERAYWIQRASHQSESGR